MEDHRDYREGKFFSRFARLIILPRVAPKARLLGTCRRALDPGELPSFCGLKPGLLAGSQAALCP